MKANSSGVYPPPHSSSIRRYVLLFVLIGTLSIIASACTVADSSPQAPSSELMLVVLLGVFLLYMAQAGAAFLLAWRQRLEDRSVLRAIFSREHGWQTWTVAIATLALPLGLSWVPSLPKIHTQGYFVQEAGDVNDSVSSSDLLVMAANIESGSMLSELPKAERDFIVTEIQSLTRGINATNNSIGSDLLSLVDRIESRDVIEGSLESFERPFLVSEIKSVANTLTSDEQGESTLLQETIIYAGCVSLLTILITIEIGLLLNTTFKREIWRQMLVAALALDIISIYIYTIFVGWPGTWGTAGGFTNINLSMTSTFVGALASSFLIILFVRIAAHKEEISDQPDTVSPEEESAQVENDER